MLDEVQLNRIKDPDIKRVVQQLANLLEQALTEIDALRAENQSLKDEINRLKGEQGKPHIKPNKPDSKDSDHSSEQKRQKPATWSKTTKNDKIVLERTERLPLDLAGLPEDVAFKGYERVIVQNLI